MHTCVLLDRFDGGLVMVMAEAIGLAQKEPFPWLDRAGLAALLAGTLILLITFFTSYSHVDIPAYGSIQVNQQIGISLLFAALAALFGEVKLASNGRCAAERDRGENRIRATEERNRTAEERIRTLEERNRTAEERIRAGEERDRASEERNRAGEERNRTAEARNRAAQDRERTARQARIQARLAAAQCRFLLADSPLNRLQLSETLALLLEDLRLS